MRDLAYWLARAARADDPEGWAVGQRVLERLEAREWLLLDHVARSATWRGQAPVSGAGWLGTHAAEASGFVAAVTSLHVDGRIRQRAARVLSRLDGPVPVTALAVRLLDHVPQVRDEALVGLRGVLGLGSAEAVLDVLLAGRGRLHAPTALASVEEVLLERVAPHDLVSALLDGDRRDVRRWALTRGHDRFTSSELLQVVATDPDQWLRAAAARRLLDVADPAQLQALLVARSVEARLVALTRLPDAALSHDTLSTLLVDRAPRVRAQARWRARRRGLDVAHWYREMIGVPALTGRVLAAVLDGLVASGGVEDVDLFLGHLGHRLPRVRSAAIVGVTTHAPHDLAVRTLGGVLLDPSPRVSSAAARALIRVRAPLSVAEPAWASTQPWSRRAAWRVARESGSWDRLEADLRALNDDDAHQAAAGLHGVRDWLMTRAATTWAVPSDAQRDRIEALLARDAVGDTVRRSVGFHAGIKAAPAPEPPASEPAPAPGAGTALSRILRWRPSAPKSPLR